MNWIKSNWFEVVLRLLAILLVSIFVTFCISDKLAIEYTLQPLISNNENIRVETKPLEILEGPLNLNINLLKYKTTIFNNTISTFEGDKKDYPHEVQLFIKYKEDDPEKLEIPFGTETYIFDNRSLTRTETILGLVNIIYLPNINLSPDLLANSSYIGINKSIQGNITVKSVLDGKSKVILYVSILILIGLVLQAFWSIWQFIFWKY